MGHKKPIRIDPLTEALPPGGVDSHAHLDSPEFVADRSPVIELAQKAGVTGIGNVFLSPEDYESRKDWFADYPGVFFLLGIHPSDGQRLTGQTLQKIEDAFKNDARIKAVGEIGLDFHWDTCPRELQMQAFARQIELAKKLAKPVVIHSREADSETLTLLEAGGFAGYPLLWHCFGGDSSLARRIIHNGWHISIPGPVTYPSNRDLREAVAKIPADRLMLETDCPYLSPVPWRGTRNQPANLVFTCRAVAECRSEAAEDIWQICGENARRFFGIS